MTRTITDPFFRQLYPRLAEELEKRIEVLAEGSALTHGAGGLLDASNTAMKYKADVASISTLKQVIELCFELDHDRYGTKQKEEEDGDY